MQQGPVMNSGFVFGGNQPRNKSSISEKIK